MTTKIAISPSPACTQGGEGRGEGRSAHSVCALPNGSASHPNPLPRIQGRGSAILCLILHLLTSSALAQPLPLQGYYRPGQYMPVKIAAAETTITASHAIQTIASPSSAHRVVPVLFLDDSASEIRINSQSLPLQPLRDTQRLVGIVDADPSIASALFATEEAIPIRLSLDDLGIPLSFDALDALLLSPRSFGRLPAQTLDILLDCGVAIVVPSTLPPDTIHNWQQRGDLHITRREISPHFNGKPGEAIYQPIAAWRPQRSGEARWLFVSIAGFGCVVFLALSVLPKKWSVMASIVVAGIAMGAIAFISRHPEMRRWNLIEPTDNGVARYLASADDQHFEETLPAAGYPVPFSHQHASDANLALHIRDDKVIIAFDLDENRRMCILESSPHRGAAEN